MQALKLNKAFTLMESGPVVLVTRHDGHQDNIMTISWAMVMDFTPVRGKCVRAPLIQECLANIECKVIDIIEKHNIFVLEAVAAYIDPTRKERRVVHAVGDGTFIVDGRRMGRKKMMASKLPNGV